MEVKYLISDQKKRTPDYLINLHSIEKNAFRYHSMKRAEYHAQFDSDEMINIEYLEQIIKYCRDNGFSPVLITPPFYEAYTMNYPQNKIDKYLKITTTVAEENNVPFFNYSQDERFKDNIDLFYNSDHLNFIGAVKFTRLLVERLKKDGILK